MPVVADPPSELIRAVRESEGIGREEGSRFGVVPAVSGVVEVEGGFVFEALPKPCEAGARGEPQLILRFLIERRGRAVGEGRRRVRSVRSTPGVSYVQGDDHLVLLAAKQSVGRQC